MLTQLRLQNCKAWRDTGSLPLAPLTLFFGANSSGKSTLALLLRWHAQQAADKTTRGTALDLRWLHQQARQHPLCFSYQWLAEPTLALPMATAEPLHFSFSASLVAGAGEQLQLQQQEFQILAGPRCLWQFTQEQDTEQTRWKIHGPQSAPVTLACSGPVPIGPQALDQLSRQLQPDAPALPWLRALAAQQRHCLQRLYFIGPQRQPGQALSTDPRQTSNQPIHSVGYQAEHCLQVLWRARGLRFQFNRDDVSHSLDLCQMLAEQLAQLGLASTLKLESDDAGAVQLHLRSPSNTEWLTLDQLGYGVQQLFPVLLQCLVAPAGAVIFIQQPEAHLHPQAQAALADVLIQALQVETLNPDATTSPRRLQCLIETHSEYLLRRLQRRIAEQQLEPSQVQAYFADQGQQPGQLQALHIDHFGRIHNWPRHFFGDEMSDISAQAKAALRRRKQPQESK